MAIKRDDWILCYFIDGVEEKAWVTEVFADHFHADIPEAGPVSRRFEDEGKTWRRTRPSKENDNG